MSATALAQRSSAAVAAIRTRTTAQSRALWASLPDYSDDGLSLWLSQMVPLVIASQQTIATLTDIYLAAVLSQMTGQSVNPVGIPPETVSGAGVRNGLPPEAEWERPFKEIWYQLTQDKAFADAVQIGEQRMLSMLSTDLQLAQTHSARNVLSASGPKLGVVGYRRVITSMKACELCQVAATQRYKVEDLMPIHNNCTCGIAPITGKSDPGQVIDAHYAPDGAEYDGWNKNAVRRYDASSVFPGVEIQQHGEIGPVLTVKGQAFRGPTDIPAAAETGA